MIYADEDFYNLTYLCGREAVITAAFDFYARTATFKIKQYTGTNVDEDNIPDEVKNCCCEIAEMIYTNAKAAAEGVGLTSESVGGWSKSYESSEQRSQSIDVSVHNVIYKWLSGTDLLFRGVR